MKAKNIIGLILVVVILGLVIMVVSQEGAKKVIVEEKVSEKVTKEDPKVQKSEEEQYLEDLKKQAGATVDYEVSKYYKTACSACHGKAGEGTSVAPGIAGKSYEYMLQKLDDYKNNRVENTLMQSGLFINVSEEDLKALAREISNFK